ncbi:DUF6722 family protein [Parabacteroides goldsteinii]|uniref:DUF6722 family protein n=1 Tax=Parabacteroides goldsteinii TaxID=328812 RepID=UPI003218E864
MSKWSFQQELKREEKELSKARKENLSKFVYDLAKLVFAGITIGGIIPLYGNPYNILQWKIVLSGVLVTLLLAYLGNEILKK